VFAGWFVGFAGVGGGFKGRAGIGRWFAIVIAIAIG